MNPRLKELLQHVKRSLEAIYQDRLIDTILYGSHARGEAGEESDVDILVVLRGPVKPYHEVNRTLDLQMEILARYGELVSVVHVSDEEFADTRHPLMMHVHKEGFPL